jgi:hypothetical protein
MEFKIQKKFLPNTVIPAIFLLKSKGKVQEYICQSLIMLRLSVCPSREPPSLSGAK